MNISRRDSAMLPTTWREYSLLKIQADIDVDPIHLLKMTCPSTNHSKSGSTTPLIFFLFFFVSFVSSWFI
ncbi:MAG TPA: hypothetical protein DC064_03250 [Cyanobacteria bacterium UBA9273]|nr:hypothetical protein [Cyanobacteria bacterium UBA9273]